MHGSGGCSGEKNEKEIGCPRGVRKNGAGVRWGGGREQVVSAMAQGVLHTRGRNMSETFSWCVKLDG